MPSSPDPLHGLTLQALLETLLDRHGWAGLWDQVPIRCFEHDPSIASSLVFLRRTPWARAKLEAFYVKDERRRARKRLRNQRRAARRAWAVLPLERPETLALVWPGKAPAPRPQVPEGYSLHAGADPAAFATVQASIGFAATPETWASLDLVPDGMVVAQGPEGAVAVACALQSVSPWIELAWVAVDPAHRGRGLGKAVCASLVAGLLASGRNRIVGSTQDARIHALRIYLDLGFEPVQRPDKVERWAAVLAQWPGHNPPA